MIDWGERKRYWRDTKWQMVATLAPYLAEWRSQMDDGLLWWLDRAQGMTAVQHATAIAQRGALVSTAGPPTTILLAWLLLDEQMSAWQLAGVALIVGGILVLDLARSRRRT